jgi:ribosomal protein S27AE
MKIQCPSCREIVELREFSTSTEGLRLRCGSCGQVVFLANANNLDEPASGSQTTPGALEPTAQEPHPAEIACPKCGHAQRDPIACHQCGLVFSRWNPATLPPDPPEAAALWRELESRPGDEELHERFLEACHAAGRLDYATRQHRMLARRGGPADLLQRMQARALRLAQARLVPGGLRPTDKAEARGRMRWLLYAILLLAVAGLTYLIFNASDLLKAMR